MRSLILGLWWSFLLVWDTLFRAIAKGASKSLEGIQNAVGFEQRVDKDLQQVMEMSDKETFEYYTGVLGYYQKTHPEYKDAIEEDLWEMRAAYLQGKIKQFIHDKQSTPMYTPHELFLDDDGTVRVINSETGEEKILENGKEEAKSETTGSAEVSVITD